MVKARPGLAPTSAHARRIESKAEKEASPTSTPWLRNFGSAFVTACTNTIAYPLSCDAFERIENNAAERPGVADYLRGRNSRFTDPATKSCASPAIMKCDEPVPLWRAA